MSASQNRSFYLDIYYKNPNIPEVSLGDKVRCLELPKKAAKGEKKDKERIQAFEGVVISKHVSGIVFFPETIIDSTITVRKMFQGGGTEKVFLLNSPWVKSIEVLDRSIVKRSKLYYLRERTGKSARLKRRL